MHEPTLRRQPEAFLRHFGIREPRHIDLEALAFHCGATVEYEKLGGCEARILGHEDKAIITVNSNSSPERRRFSLAHELGHWNYDRGTIGFACTGRQFTLEWGAASPERRANRYASELLLPEYLFRPDAANREITLETVKELKDKYRTSLTATALRLVKLGSFPSMFLCTSAAKGRVWFATHPDVPHILWPCDRPGRETVAYHILQGHRTSDTTYAPADAWISHPDASRYIIREESVPLGQDHCLSLLWWEDQAQVIDAAGIEPAGNG